MDEHFSSIILQSGALVNIDRLIPSLDKYHQIVLLYHPLFKQLYIPQFLFALQRLGRPIIEIVIPAGEESKSLAQAEYCWKEMLAHNTDRHAVLIAFGGGVICDLGGFVASCYMRGLDSFYIPTTLLAMIDAAIGGKTGVNFQQVKNLIGTFHQPHSIVIDPSLLNTLPEREFCSGLAELIKYGIIGDLSLIESLEKCIEQVKEKKEPLLTELIGRCIAIKNKIVSLDERDLNGMRATLNYGHTFAHAIEATTDYCHYLHGEAVAIGMSCAASLGLRLGLCDASVLKRQDDLLHRAGLPTQFAQLPVEKIIEKMRSDKKGAFNKINLILPERIGKVVEVSDIDSHLIEDVLLKKMNF